MNRAVVKVYNYFKGEYHVHQPPKRNRPCISIKYLNENKDDNIHKSEALKW